jgi:hypothetical protein
VRGPCLCLEDTPQAISEGHTSSALLQKLPAAIQPSTGGCLPQGRSEQSRRGAIASSTRDCTTIASLQQRNARGRQKCIASSYAIVLRCFFFTTLPYPLQQTDLKDHEHAASRSKTANSPPREASLTMLLGTSNLTEHEKHSSAFPSVLEATAEPLTPSPRRTAKTSPSLLHTTAHPPLATMPLSTA